MKTSERKLVLYLTDTSRYIESLHKFPAPTGFLCGWSVGLEFPAGQLAESYYWREQFQTISEDVSVRNVLMHSAH